MENNRNNTIDDEGMRLIFSLSYVDPNLISDQMIALGEDLLFNSKNSIDFTRSTICSELTQMCEHVQYFPKTRTIVMTNSDMCQLVELPQTLVENVATKLAISHHESLTEISHFFSDKTLIVKPHGVEGLLYKLGIYTEGALPALYTHNAIAAAARLGFSGPGLLLKSPLLFVSIASAGGLFFNGLGMAAGSNKLGTSFKAIGWTLNRPLAGVEMVLNQLVLRPISSIIGIPMILNATQEQSKGFGIPVEEAFDLAKNASSKYGKKTALFLISKLEKFVKKLK